MPHNGENGQFDTEYQAVADFYRKVGGDEPAAELHRQVLRQAAQASESSPGLQRLSRWLRPMTAIATVALTVVLVVRLDDLGSATMSPVPGVPATSHPASAGALRDAALDTLEAVRTAGEEIAGTSVAGSPDRATEDTVLRNEAAATIIPGDQSCSQEQRETASTWWQCIQSLESRGLTTSATRELEEMLVAFPSFTAPR